MSIQFEKKGAMADVAASPNDPVFINHHAMIDCILEEWLQRGTDTYPTSDEIHEGHRADDYIVPIMPLYMHKDMFKTADNFGYSCRLPDPNGDGGGDGGDGNGGGSGGGDGGGGGDNGNGSVSVQAYATLVIGLLVAAVHINML